MSIVVIGSGLAGLSVAHSLLHDFGPQLAGAVEDVTLVEKGEVMGLTSSASTGGYRNFFPADKNMTEFVTRSIRRLEALAAQSQNVFELNRRGYLFLTDSKEEYDRLSKVAEAASANGSGPVRSNQYSPADPFKVDPETTGMDLVDDPAVIRTHFPFVTPAAKYMKHVRCAGYLNVARLGEYLLQEFTKKGGRLIKGEVTKVHRGSQSNAVESVEVKESTGESRIIKAKAVILALGPYLNGFCRTQFNFEYPLQNEIHAKAVIRDPLGIFPQTAPFTLWNSPTELYWSDDERKELEKNPALHWMLKPIAPADHLRPLSDDEASGPERTFAGIWTYDCPMVDEPVFPIQLDERYGEIVVRGLVSLIPELKRYFTEPQFNWRDLITVVKGYYCKTPENLPLIGPAGSVGGLYICGALSGLGIMSSQAAGELAAIHAVNRVLGKEAVPLPSYAKHFLPTRYSDADFLQKTQNHHSKSGQL